MTSMLVVGSVGLDTIHNHLGTHQMILGGSATFGALAGSLFTPVQLVGIVGSDYPSDALDLFRSRGVDLAGLEVVEGGKTFHWEGKYSPNLTSRETLKTDLNCFADFHPKIPDAFRKTPYVFLGNIAPELQLEVLDQVESPKLVVADTMNFWIDSKLDELKKVLARVDVLVINEEEARDLSGSYNIVDVARGLLAMGPRTVVIKRGEYGAMLFEDEHIFSAPAYPCHEVADPTGAGDTFAGGFLGHIAQRNDVSNEALRRAVVYGSAAASCCVEGVGVTKLATVSQEELSTRFEAFQRLSRFD